jgi:ADP-ribose pyrophosphatase YjhB (NUDIX family)
VDALAGGHAAAGQSDTENAIRECEEEVGLHLDANEIVHLGSRRLENPGAACERVLQEYFLCIPYPAIDDLRFSDEVTALAEVDLDQFADLVDGRRDSIPALIRTRKNGGRTHVGQVSAAQLAGYGRHILESFRVSIELVRRWMNEHAANDSPADSLK